MENKPTMEEKYDALPRKGRDIVDAVIAEYNRVGLAAANRVWIEQCAKHEIKLGESCALQDIILYKIRGK